MITAGHKKCRHLSSQIRGGGLSQKKTFYRVYYIIFVVFLKQRQECRYSHSPNLRERMQDSIYTCLFL